ncbi:TlpA disulfide reductase family protein [Bacillus sp. FJAT-45350]|uniref:TlpA disulfide reductase family protein n=1 Tax=Bacillus sp. FJAT-45350 TaxID=2011014 RepID=UPI000BB8D6F4|nr:TlpA disulfide reductase family protein [Bacillus sp. FJAT-45350]
MKQTRKAFYFSVLFFILFALGSFYQQSNTVFNQVDEAVAAAAISKVGPYEGNQAVSFSLPDENNQIVTLEDYKGKTVILNFFASWCPPCQEEMPVVVDFSKKINQKEDAVFLGINMTHQEKSKENVTKFLEHFHADFKVLYDEDGKTMKDYQIIGIPTTVVIGKDGKVVRRINGMVTPELVEELSK